MIFNQTWRARAIVDGTAGAWFPAEVPGNVQNDYARFMGFGDLNVGTNYEKLLETEDWFWEYETELAYEAALGERIFFVTKGIDYRWDVRLDGETLLSHEGMFSPAERDITELVHPGAKLSVLIHPHPKRADARKSTRDEADHSVKPPVCYGWDWHPRLLVSGLWEETYIETRRRGYIRACEPLARLEQWRGVVDFDVDCDEDVAIAVFDPDGVQVGVGRHVVIDEPRLWWCNGQGESCLYRWTAKSATDEREGTFGLRMVSLAMNEGSWAQPREFPKSRSDAPAQLVLNGRRVLAKGSNFVSTEIFNGVVQAGTYEAHVRLAQEAHMNIFRCWGGSGVQKEAFYDCCDRAGIMLWVEFPLACNNYPDDAHYLAVLEQEATAIIRRLRRHPSVVLWCGGNELFNSWSGMTEQSLPLRLLGKLTYELDPARPFIPTSPLNGMAHGGYTFDDDEQGVDCFTLFQRAHGTAYTEFGVPGIQDAAALRGFIPAGELFPIRKTPAWVAHHAFEAWGAERWLSMATLEKYAPGPLDTLEKVCAVSQWLQCEGYKAIFEEARRQRPHLGMVINWCWCEPWPCAVNNSLIAYPIEPKKAYGAVKEALRPALFSARVPKFMWRAGEKFSAEIWLLHDAPGVVSGRVHVTLELGDKTWDLLDWSAQSEENLIGPSVNIILPDCAAATMRLRLEAGEMSSEYVLCYRGTAPADGKRWLNM